MRLAFISTLMELAEQDDRVNLIVGDLGFGVVEGFAEKFPRRFVNAGVAEQNMTGIAAGMARCGKIVFTYSIGNFPTLRCLEQIRNDLCYHNANVKIVSVGGGFAYGALGVSHHAMEDVAVMRALPGMTVIAPGDPIEARHATRLLAACEGPAYLRLGRSGEPIVHAGDVDFALGKAIRVLDGDDITLISSGTMLHAAIEAAKLLARDGIHARVLSMHTIKPLDTEAILSAAKETSAIFTVEEHSIIGGIGSAVAEILAEGCDRRIVFKRIGISSEFGSVGGSQEFLKDLCLLSPKGISQTVADSLGILSSQKNMAASRR